MVTVVADGRIAIVDATHDVGPRGGSYFDKSAPGIIGIRGHAGGVEKNSYRIPIETVLDENIVVRRDEKIVSGGNSADPEFEAIIKKFLEVSHIDQPESLAAKNLLSCEDIVDVVRRQAAAETVRH